MAYVINKSDGTALTTLQDATVDNTTSITLVGRNYIGYGEAQNENYLFLLENFSHDTAPVRPIAGQLWHDNTINVIKVYDGTQWAAVGSATISATAPTDAPDGALWLKTPANTLHTWNGTQWIFIGPETAEGFGTTRAQSTTLLSDSSISYPVIKLTVNDSVIGILSTTAFTINASNAVTGFTTLQAGLTLSSSTVIGGNLVGNASTASALSISRTINGVGFDGTSNITVRASTTNALTAGDYITGSSFDGSTATTWNINATSANSIGTVVARNSGGGFSAGLITANLAGNVTGNVTASSGTSRFDIVEANTFIGATLSGNAFSATKLRTARNINGVAFDGQTDITVPAAAATLTGVSLASGIINSNLEQVGTLLSLSVAGAITINTNLSLESTGALSTVTALRTLKFNVDDTTTDAAVKIISGDASVLAGTGSKGALTPDTDVSVDLGKSNLKWDNVHAVTFNGNLIGNASTATLATTANNLPGGATGSIAYQASAGTTALLPAGVAGQVLHTAGTVAAPYWSTPALADLTPGSYLLGTAFDGSAVRTFAVDATSANTADKVVARDSSGNFSAGTITATLSGNATSATNASFSTTQAANDSSTKIATTAFVTNAILNSKATSMTISGPAPNITTPSTQFAQLIEAKIGASTVPAGTNFELIINQLTASSSSSFSAGRFINAYQWGTASVSTSTTLTVSGTGYKLIYQSNGTTWNYTGTWSTI